MLKLITKKSPIISLKAHYLRKNKVLIKRKLGGFGDILMHRMIFEDFKKQYPHLEFYWSVPHKFIGMATNHPYVETIDLNSIKNEDFGAIYDTTIACTRHETRTKNNKINRSDIWAKHCGIHLKNHNMHLETNEETNNEFRLIIKNINTQNKPTILLATHSTDDNVGISKSLSDEQIKKIVLKTQELGYFVYTVHNKSLPIYDELGITQFTDLKIPQWLSIVQISDYIISVDTSTFHIAGGLKKPLVGIFTFTDGKVYGKHYDFILVQKHRDDGNWDCGPCFNLTLCPKSPSFPKPCLTELKTEDIIEGLLKAFRKWPCLNL